MSDSISADLRSRVRERARRRCEYCLLHEEDGFYPHEIDHIISRKHRGETSYSNLAWACFLCNHFKGTDLASIDLDTGRLVRLFHPRRDRWITHFRLQRGLIQPMTGIARVTEYLLQFNTPDNVEMREALISERRYPTSD